jgi:hypothetical protein
MLYIVMTYQLGRPARSLRRESKANKR